MLTNVLRRGSAAVAVLAIGLVAVAGAQDSYDISQGEYLTEKEYKELSKDEAIDYCEKLAQEIDLQNDNAAAANAAMSDIEAEIEDLKNQVSQAKSANDPLASEVAQLEAKLRELKELPRSYTVVKGDYLIKISGMPRIYSDETAWKRIYRANRDKIDDPNLIYPDQIFLIPRGVPTQHTVAEGENLARIAGYHEIYGDRSQWNRIYDANKATIGADPSVITPGMVLQIPR
jgi:nucleoid-associated protein YgaU